MTVRPARIFKWLILLAVFAAAATTVSFLVFYLSLSPYSFEKYSFDGQGDGFGKVRLAGDSWTAGSDGNSIHVEYTAGKGGIMTNGGIKVNIGHILEIGGMKELYVPSELTIAALLIFDFNPYKDFSISCSAPSSQVKLAASAPSKYQVIKNYISLIKYKRSETGMASCDNLIRDVDRNINLTVNIQQGKLKEGDRVDIFLKNIRAPQRETDWDIVVTDDCNGDGIYGYDEQAMKLHTRADKALKLYLSAPMNARPGQEMELLVTAVDGREFPGKVSNYRGTVKFSSSQPVEGLPREYSFRAEDNGVKRFVIRQAARTYFKISALDETGIKGRSNYIDTRPHGDSIWFGDPRVHSVISYFGGMAPEFILRRKRDFEGLDFVCLADKDLSGVPPFTDMSNTLGMTYGEWEYIRNISGRFHDPGKFVTLIGYDWASEKYGGRSIYFGPEVDRFPIFSHGKDEYDTPLKLDEGLIGMDALVANYSAAMLRGSNYYEWGPSTDRQRFVEIYNSDGSSEFYDNRYNIDMVWKNLPLRSILARFIIRYKYRQASKGSGRFVQDILAKGWKLGFTASSNDYNLSWVKQAYRPGLTAVFSRELDRHEIYDSLKERRSYATTGARIGLRFTCNNLPMGSIIKAAGVPRLYCEVLGTDRIKSVELVKFEGKYSILAKKTSLNDMASFHFIDNAFMGKAFYYVRVTQEDGSMAWSSPIWVEKVK